MHEIAHERRRDAGAALQYNSYYCTVASKKIREKIGTLYNKIVDTVQYHEIKVVHFAPRKQ